MVVLIFLLLVKIRKVHIVKIVTIHCLSKNIIDYKHIYIYLIYTHSCTCYSMSSESQSWIIIVESIV